MTSRRNFIAAAGAAMVGGLPFSAVAQEAGEIRLGVASYSTRKKSLAETIQALKLMNIRFLKVKLEAHLPFTSTPAQIDDARKMIQDAGIVLESTGNNALQKDEAEIRMKFEFNKKLGVPMMIIAPTATTLPIVEKYVKEFDIKVAIHNHGPEDKHFPTAKSVLTAIKGMDPRVGLCLDVGHSSRAGEDIVAATKAAGSRMLDVDVKDLRQKLVASSQCDVGDGELPLAGVFKALVGIKYAGVVHLEYEINDNDPVPGMQRSFSHLRGIIAGMKA